MTRIADIYDKYIGVYTQYQGKAKRINDAHVKTMQTKNKWDSTKQEILTNQKEHQESLLRVESTKKDVLRYKPQYEKDLQKSNDGIENELNKYKNSLSGYNGSLIDSNVYQNQVISYKQSCIDEENAYYQHKEEELTKTKQRIETEQQQLHQSKDQYIKDKKANMANGVFDVLVKYDYKEDIFKEKKKYQVEGYLNSNDLISKSEQGKAIIDSLHNDKLNASDYQMTSEKLVQKLCQLPDLSEYATEDIITKEDIDEHPDDYTSIVPIVLGVIGVLLVLLFAFGFSPAQLIVPSGSSIADFASGIVNFVVNFVIATFGLSIVAAIGIGIFSIFGLFYVGAVLGGLLGLYIWINLYSAQIFSLSTSSTMGFGNVVSTIIVWIFQIILIGIILFVVYLIIQCTPLIYVVYKPKNSKVLSDFDKFVDIYNKNKSLYLALFHFNEALGYTCEHVLKNDLNKVKNQLTQIKNEKGYKDIKVKWDLKLEELSQERQDQLAEEKSVNLSNQILIESKKKELNDAEFKRRNSVLTKMRMLQEANDRAVAESKELENKINTLTNSAKKLEAEYEACVKTENDLVKSAAEDKKYLEEFTNLNMQDRDDLNNYLISNSTLTELLECQGNLSPNMYFVRKKLDNNNMAIIKKIPMNGKPIVFLYDNSFMTGNNLSEGLCHVLDWIYTSIKRSNNLYLIHDLFVVDMVSGQSVLHYPPYNQEMVVFTNEREKNELTDMLLEKEENVRNQCNDYRISKVKMVSSIDELNQVKMQINKNDIEQNPDIAFPNLMQKTMEYNFVSYIVSPCVDNIIQPSVLNEQLKLLVNNSQRSGILPMFLIDKDTWKRSKDSKDVAYIQSIQDKDVYEITNVGKDSNGELLDIRLV